MDILTAKQIEDRDRDLSSEPPLTTDYAHLPVEAEDEMRTDADLVLRAVVLAVAALASISLMIWMLS